MGKGSAGIVLKSTVDNYREYLQTALSSVLMKDSIYVIELSIKSTHVKNQNEWATDRLEVFLSNDSVQGKVMSGFIPSRIDTPPSKVFFLRNIIDTVNWYRYRGFYRAIGNERFVIIGNFSPEDSIDIYPLISNPNNPNHIAYYLIDNVMVYKASDTIVRKQPEPILPNVFSPNQDGVNEVYAIEHLPENSTLEVFNRWGSLVFTQAPYQNNWPGHAPNGNPLADGVYFAILTYQDQNGKLQQKKQTVHVVR
jgi:gliding motility-associated-like protein